MVAQESHTGSGTSMGMTLVLHLLCIIFSGLPEAAPQGLQYTVDL